MTWQELETWLTNSPRRPLVMGIVNVTPDSFSDGGRFADHAAAIEHGRKMIRDGADLLDVGGESTRPGAQRIPAEEQIRRTIPVIEALRDSGAVISIDTTRSMVAAAAMKAGARVVNDISGGLDDPAILFAAAQADAAIVLMHMRGQPATMQKMASYRDVVAEVRGHLATRRDAAVAAGIPKHRILLDPGIGFAKGTEHNLQILRHLAEFRSLNQPLLVGVSRKKFIGQISGEIDAPDRLFGTAATVAWTVANGADVVRVHDVAAMAKVVRTVRAIAAVE